MANLYVSLVGGVQYSVAKNPAGTATLTTSGTSTKTTLNANKQASVAVVYGDAAHYVTTGPSATVTASAANSIYVPANTARELALGPGEEVAAITV